MEFVGGRGEDPEEFSHSVTFRKFNVREKFESPNSEEGIVPYFYLLPMQTSARTFFVSTF